jgi:hypothetical protein
VLATLRDRLRSGDVWVERSSGYRRFDSYLLPAGAVPAAAAELGLPATADEWLAARGAEVDRRLRHFARRLKRGELGRKLGEAELDGWPGQPPGRHGQGEERKSAALSEVHGHGDVPPSGQPCHATRKAPALRLICR